MRAAPHRSFMRQLLPAPCRSVRHSMRPPPTSAPCPKRQRPMRQGTLRMRGVSVPPPKYNAACWHAAPPSVLRYESADWAAAVARAASACAGTDGKLRVAAFDMDGTLIRVASGAKFPARPGDAAVWDAAVVPALQAAAAEGRLIAIFTNQGGVARGRCGGVDGMKQHIDRVQRLLGVPLAAYAALQRDRYRKPQVGMWQLFLQNLPRPVDMAASYFVGDALGRAGDFSDSDAKFALNFGLRCLSPEEHFLGAPRPAMLRQPHFKPHVYTVRGEFSIGFSPEHLPPLADILSPPDLAEKLLAKARHVVVLQGAPCSGKTRFARLHLPDHRRISAGEVARLKSLLKEKDAAPIVVDGAHMTKSSRVKVIKVAREIGVPVYCLPMATPKDVVLHFNVVREVLSDPDDDVKQLGVGDFNNFYKREQEPSEEEGFDVVGEVKFRAAFENEHEKTVFLRYTSKK